MTDGRFAGTVVIVTGAGVGIGAATAQRFAAEGATVVGVGRTEETLERTAAHAEGVVEVAVGDVSDQDAITAIIDGVAARHGRLDVPASRRSGRSNSSTPRRGARSWRPMSTVSSSLPRRAAAPAPRGRLHRERRVGVRARRGLGSGRVQHVEGCGHRSDERDGALDHAAEGVRVNTVHPSLTVTDMAAPHLERPEVFHDFLERISMGRPAQPSEVAGVIAFLGATTRRS